MRIFLISTLLLLVGCSSYPKKNGYDDVPLVHQTAINPYFSNTELDYVYKAQIEAFNKSFGGILAIKKLGESHHRMVFTTELGNTIFDFSYKNDSFYVNKIIKDLDRKIVVNILKRDFFALIHENPKIEKTYQNDLKLLHKGLVLGKKHYYLTQNGKLSRIIRTRNERENVIIEFHKVSVNIAKEISIRHEKINLRTNLKAI